MTENATKNMTRPEPLELRAEELPPADAAFWASITGQAPKRGWRHYLNQEPIHAGDMLELLLDDDCWYLVRYEWTYSPDDSAALYFESDRAIDHRSEMLFRWPTRS